MNTQNNTPASSNEEAVTSLQMSATADRILRALVPEPWKGSTSAIGAVQSYIAELEKLLDRALDAALAPPKEAPAASAQEAVEFGEELCAELLAKHASKELHSWPSSHDGQWTGDYVVSQGILLAILNDFTASREPEARHLREGEPLPPPGKRVPQCKNCGGCREWGGNGLWHHLGCPTKEGAVWLQTASREEAPPARRWISVADPLPDHDQTVPSYGRKEEEDWLDLMCDLDAVSTLARTYGITNNKDDEAAVEAKKREVAKKWVASLEVLTACLQATGVCTQCYGRAYPDVSCRACQGAGSAAIAKATGSAA